MSFRVGWVRRGRGGVGRSNNSYALHSIDHDAVID